MSDSESENESVNDQRSSSVDLGYIEKAPSWKLESRFFPCKVGFKPAWLSLNEDIPTNADLVCLTCGKTLLFLCQLYAPIDNREDCFHRTLYVFVCSGEKCQKGSMKVYRSQLARINKFYPFDAPQEKEDWKPEINTNSFGVSLCSVCGIQSKSQCSNCRKVFYCSKEHQLIDWKNGHKRVCKKNLENNHEANRILFPEFEVVIEPENTSDDENQHDNTSIKNDYKETMPDSTAEELSKLAFSEEDKVFASFKEVVKHSPSQVIRYEKRGRPLWISGASILQEKDIPPCQYCGSKRTFEFQVMPQLLNYLELEPIHASLDWGILVVYTCDNSCQHATCSYKEEFIYKQDVDSSTSHNTMDSSSVSENT